MNEVGEDIRDAQDGLKATFLDVLKRIDEDANAKVKRSRRYTSLPKRSPALHSTNCP